MVGGVTMRWGHSVVLLAFVVSGWTSAAAQTRATTADLVGVVYDQSRALLPGVSVTATSTATNQSRSMVTDGTGRFTIPALPPGVYRVVAELGGFTPQTRESVVLQLGTEVELEFTLYLASIQQQVDVVASPPLVDRTQTAIATVVTQQQITYLPINGRDFISFSVITPGVTRDNTPQQGASATSGLTFAGQRARSNNISVDGLDNNDITVGSVRAVFSQEAVREFQVVTNSYSAEFGKASGGVVNIITKSGTNTPSGNAFCLLPGLGAEFEGRFRAVHAGGRPDHTRQGAIRTGAVRRHVRRSYSEGSDILSSGPSSAWISTPPTSSSSTTRRPSSCSASRLGQPPASCARQDFLSRPATCHTQFDPTSSW